MKGKNILTTVLCLLTMLLLVAPAVQQHAKLFRFKPLHGVTVVYTPPP